MTASSTAPTLPSTAPGPATATGRVVVVRPLAEADLPRTAALQAAAPPPGALDVPTALGATFLRRWQAAHLASPHAVALVAEQADDNAGSGDDRRRTAGVLLAVLDRRAHRDHLLRQHGPELGAALATASLRSPRALTGWARLRGGPLVQAVTLLPTRGAAAARTRRAEAGAGQVPRVVELDALVVDPALCGTGVGRQLLAALAERAADAGLGRVEARVPWGSGAEGFFSACGWTSSTTRPSPRGGFETRLHLDL